MGKDAVGMDMQLTYVVLGAIFAAVAAALMVVIFVRHGSSFWAAAAQTNERLREVEADLLAVREAKAGAGPRLAL